MIRKLLLVLTGGFCGAMTRYLLATPLLALARALPDASVNVPYDTLFINLSGAFLIGLLFGAFEHGAPISPDLRLALGTGFLGAYTTFSSFAVGAASQLQHGAALMALLYLCGTMGSGVALACAGSTLAGRLAQRQRLVSFSALERALSERTWEDETAVELAHDEPLAELEARAR